MRERIFVATNPVQHAETLNELAVRYRQLLLALNSGQPEHDSVRELLAVHDNIAVLIKESIERGCSSRALCASSPGQIDE